MSSQPPQQPPSTPTDPAPEAGDPIGHSKSLQFFSYCPHPRTWPYNYVIIELSPDDKKHWSHKEELRNSL